MSVFCVSCARTLPHVPGLSLQAQRRGEMGASSSYVSHVCSYRSLSDEHWLFVQSISFLTGYENTVTRTARVWNDDSLWDL